MSRIDERLSQLNDRLPEGRARRPRPRPGLDQGARDPGRHARSAIGLAELPFDIPVEIEAIVQL
jgi:enamine deaminase RidA (YjgF/YER057c/UK114 family)